jgi:hypothetical protein
MADRCEAAFCDRLGPRKCPKIEFAVMDMWKLFRNATKDKAPQARGGARQGAQSRICPPQQQRSTFHQGIKYDLQLRQEDLKLEGKRSLKILLAANRRLNTAYVLKEAFGELWDYEREAWAWRFFENWRASLKWRRLEPYERFADMINRHWDCIAASYCNSENKVSLGSSRASTIKSASSRDGHMDYVTRYISASRSYMHVDPPKSPLHSLKTHFFLSEYYGAVISLLLRRVLPDLAIVNAYYRRSHD